MLYISKPTGEKLLQLFDIEEFEIIAPLITLLREMEMCWIL
jgi:hypothetical protein